MLPTATYKVDLKSFLASGALFFRPRTDRASYYFAGNNSRYSTLTVNQETNTSKSPGWATYNCRQYFQSPGAKSCAIRSRAQPWVSVLLYALSFTFPFFADAVSLFCLCNPTWLARDLKLQPIKITQFFGTGTGYRKVKKQGNLWLPRKRKECAPEFKTLADYVIPRNNSSLRGSRIWFSYIHNFKLIQLMNKWINKLFINSKNKHSGLQFTHIR